MSNYAEKGMRVQKFNRTLREFNRTQGLKDNTRTDFFRLKLKIMKTKTLNDSKRLSDPHVRIVGRKEDVLRAKDKVMAVLDAKVS